MSLGAFKQTTINVGPTPVITGATGDIVSTFSTDLTLSVTTTYSPTGAVDVLYYDGATLVATTTNVSIGSGSFSTTVPSSVYGKAVGTNITIRVRNYPGGKESLTSATETVLGLPTGGSISVSGNDRWHVFNSSSTFTVPTGFSRSMRCVVIGGAGGGGGYKSGSGGGAGGAKDSNFTINAGSYTVTIGGGGIGSNSDYHPSSYGYAGSGGGSSIAGVVSVSGGGKGGSYDPLRPGGNGGSGGGGSTGGTAVSGEGSNGASNSNDLGPGSGGGGKGGAGVAGVNYVGGRGGYSANFNITGSTLAKAGGGGGGSWIDFAFTNGAGGGGGAGRGNDGVQPVPSACHGTANTGSGGGGGGWYGDWSTSSPTGGSGGSGYVAIRYTI